jgi:tRNA A-37 threonylcarbamoyl transferase component Bud32
MTSDDLQHIRASTGWRRHRTEVIRLAGGPVVVKGQRPARAPGGAGALSLLASLTGLSLVKPAPAPGGTDGQAIEVGRLTALRAAGLLAPQVLHVAPEFFVMEFLAGPNMAQAMEDQPAQALSLWRQGLQALLALHAQGQYLSQAFARNFILSPQGVAAIDFEDDPAQAMPLLQAQARDWLLYLQSTVWLLPADAREAAQATWQSTIAAESPAVTAALRAAVGRLGWMRHLPASRKPWGRDIISAQAAAAFLYNWASSPAARQSS